MRAKGAFCNPIDIQACRKGMPVYRAVAELAFEGSVAALVNPLKCTCTSYTALLSGFSALLYEIPKILFCPSP